MAERGGLLSLTGGAYACVGKRRNYASSGAWFFSLIETLIAMAIGAVLLLGAARFLPALQRRVLRQTQQQALEK